MARKRDKTSPEELLKLVESGQKKFLRYDEARIIYSMGESYQILQNLWNNYNRDIFSLLDKNLFE